MKKIKSIIPAVALVLLCNTAVRAETAYDTVVPNVMNGAVSYFDSNNDLPAGWYRIQYMSGAMHYNSSYPATVDDTATPGNGFKVQHNYTGLGNGVIIEAPGNDTGFSTQAQVEAHNAGAEVFFYHTEGKIGVYLFDDPYGDNGSMVNITSHPAFKLFGVPCNELPFSLTAVGFNGNDFEVEADGLVGVNVSIDGSYDLLSWTNIDVVAIQTGGTVVPDDATGLDYRFYRLKVDGCSNCTGDVVGFYERSATTNTWSLHAVQLDNPGGNTLLNLFPDAPNGSLVVTGATGSAQSTYFIHDGAWYDLETDESSDSVALLMGDGFFFWNPSTTTPLTLTFTGKIREGNLLNAVPTGVSLKASMIPQAGSVTSLGLSVPNGTTLQKLTAPHTWTIYTFSGGAWDTVPSAEIGEAFHIEAINPGTWNRAFSVCD